MNRLLSAPRRIRRISGIFSALFILTAGLPASEWQDIKDQYKMCSVVGGLGEANGTDNPNEWNNAEGLAATSAELSEPHSAMADLYGRIYVADKNANAIRRIDPDGTIHTVAGMNLEELPGATTNAGYSGDGPARQQLLDGPQHAYVMPDGTFYIMDTGNHRIRRVDTAGMMTTIINDPEGLNRGLWVQRQRQIVYYCTNTQLKRWTPGLGENPGVLLAGGFEEASNIDVDRFGNIYVTDRGKSAVYRVPFSHDGSDVTPSMIVAGTGTNKDSEQSRNGDSATDVGLLEVRGIAFHPLGGYFLATHAGGDIWYVDSGGDVHLFIQGNSANAHNPRPFSVPANDGDEISEPRSVSVSLNGDILIASNDAGFIRVVRSTLPPPAAPKWDTVLIDAAAGARLRWQTEPGQWYLLDRSPSMTAGSWTPLTLLPAAGTSLGFTDPFNAELPGTFYRVHALRSWPN